MRQSLVAVTLMAMGILLAFTPSVWALAVYLILGLTFYYVVRCCIEILRVIFKSS